MIAELKALTEVAQVVKLVQPFFTKKKKKDETPKPTIVGGEYKNEFRELKEEREFDWKRTLATIITTALMIFAVNQGWITKDQADAIDDVIEEKIVETLEA